MRALKEEENVALLNTKSLDLNYLALAQTYVYCT